MSLSTHYTNVMTFIQPQQLKEIPLRIMNPTRFLTRYEKWQETSNTRPQHLRLVMASLTSQDWSTPMKSYTSQASSPPDKVPGLRNGHVLPDAYIALSDPKLPVISTEARDNLLREISQSHPTRPDESEILSCDPLLSLSSLQHYCDLFFTRFNKSYPLIHQATFNADDVHTFLLMSILLLGATYSDKEAHLLAICIHDIMRPLIHSSKEFSTKPKLWMLQTILLVECFGKSRAGQKQHEMRLVPPFVTQHRSIPF
jgi:hypothetical protein